MFVSFSSFVCELFVVVLVWFACLAPAVLAPKMPGRGIRGDISVGFPLVVPLLNGEKPPRR